MLAEEAGLDTGSSHIHSDRVLNCTETLFEQRYVRMLSCRVSCRQALQLVSNQQMPADYPLS